MHDEEHKLTIKAPKCGNEDCECADMPDTIEGTIEEVVQKVNDESYERDEFILEIIAEQTAVIARLLQTVELLAYPAYKTEGPGQDDLFGNIGDTKLN